MSRYQIGVWLVFVGMLPGMAWAADEPKPVAPGTLVIIDANGKENIVKAYKILQGTRRLSWLAPLAPDKSPEDKEDQPKRQPAVKPLQGPEALAVREEDSTNLVEGVLTLVPLDRIRSIDFDNEKQVMTVRVAIAPEADKDLTLTGSTRFAGINKITIEADVDKGMLGIAEVKFQGGVPRGIRGVRFPPPKGATPAPTGRPATITVSDRQKKYPHKVTDVQMLYRLAGGEKLSPLIFFRKTVKIDLNKIKGLEMVGGEGTDWRVALTDGNDETLTLLEKVTLDEKPALLVGFLGHAPAGYKLFPSTAVNEVQFEKKGE